MILGHAYISLLIVHSDCFRFSRDHWERPSCREGSMENDSLPRFCASHMACSWSLSLCVIAFSWKDKRLYTYAIIGWRPLYKNWVLHFIWPLWLSLVPSYTHSYPCFEAIKHILDHGFKFLQVVSSFILLLTQCLRCQQWKKARLFIKNLGREWVKKFTVLITR